MAVALDELHDQRSDGGHRSSLEESYGNVSGKKNRASFQAQIPCKLQFKNHFKIPGIFKTILGKESAGSLWRKRHFFSKRSKRWRGFPPGGMFMDVYGRCIYGPVLRLSTPPSPPHGLGPQVAAPIPFYLQAIGSISEVQLRIC